MHRTRTPTESIPSIEAPRLAARADWASRLLALPVAGQTAVWFVLIALLESHALWEPPVWDSAMGVFPPAIYLHEHGFDVRQLLQQPNWWQGGPNVHSLSLFTWFVALVMHAAHAPAPTFLIVHLSTFLLVAWSLAHFARSLRIAGVESRSALASAGLVLLTPLVLVQVGAMYTESWVMALGVVAWAKWQDDRPGAAVALCILALFVKLTGIAIFLCIAALLVVSNRPRRGVRVALLAAMMLAFVALRSLPGLLGATPYSGPRWGDAAMLAPVLVERLLAIPDVALLVSAALVLSALFGARTLPWSALRSIRTGLDARTGARLVCFAMPPIFALGVVVSVFAETIFLPRYLVPVVPFAVAAVVIVATGRARPEWLRTGLVAGCAIQLVNFDGALYDDRTDGFSILERSHAYRAFHQSQIELIDAIAAAPRGLPVFVSRDLDYMLSSPMMGYVEVRPENVLPIYLPPQAGRPIRAYPDEFLLAFSTASMGGEEVVRLVQAAGSDPSYEIRQRRFAPDEREASLFWVRRRPATASDAPVDAPTTGAPAR